MLEYIQGDAIQALENGDITVLAHACNFSAGMGAGIARALHNKFKNVADWDEANRGRSALILVGASKNVLNSYCMLNPGPPRENTADDFKSRLERFKADLELCDYEDVIGIPLVLSGLAKHDRSISDLEYFKKYIAPELESYNLKVYYL